MRRFGWVSLAVIAFAAAGGAHAQEAPTTSAGSSANPPVKVEEAVISYPPSFFAAQRPNTAWDMVDRLPGFTYDGGDSVRGFAGAAGNVVIDGQRPTTKNDDLQSMLKRIPAGDVDHIEVIRGGAPGIDMHGKTVIANVVRKKSAGLHGDIALVNIKTENGPDLPQARVEGSWQWGQARFDAGVLVAKFVDDGSFSGPRYTYDANHNVTDFSRMQDRAGGWQNNFTGAVELPLAGGKFKANIFVQDQPYDARYADDFIHAGSQVEVDHQDKTDGELGLHWERDLAKGLSLETLTLQHWRRNDFRSSFQAPGDDELFTLGSISSEAIGRGILHWTPNDKLTVEGGGEYAVNKQDSRTAFILNGSALSLPAANVQVEEKRAEGFTTATWRINPKFTVEAGARVEQSTLTSTGDVILKKSLTYPKPRLVLTWSPEANDQLRVRFEREVGQLDFGQFVASSSLNGSGVQAGNPNLVPQKDWAAEAAWEHRFWSKGAVTLTLRHLQLEDVIDRKPITDPGCSDIVGNPHYSPTCPVGGIAPSIFDQPDNIGDGSENDVVLSFSIPLDRFHIPGGTFKGSSTWRMSRVTDPTTGAKRSISGQHERDQDFHFAQDLPRWKMNWGVDLQTGWSESYYRFNEIDTFDNGSWVTVWGEYKPKPGLAIRAEIDNAGRRPFTVTRGVYAGPRNTNPTPTFVDFQDHNFGMELYVRLRKTFG